MAKKKSEETFLGSGYLCWNEEGTTLSVLWARPHGFVNGFVRPQGGFKGTDTPYEVFVRPVDAKPRRRAKGGKRA